MFSGFAGSHDGEWNNMEESSDPSMWFFYQIMCLLS